MIVAAAACQKYSMVTARSFLELTNGREVGW